ncbi:MAG: CNNM domain-containing protein [Holosporales bacterium]|jgi:Mg2+/Co2+ transporter CorB|nr:CNNM domain-containing protein [Holosporales bacterium]
MFLDILVALALLASSAYFSLCETAMTGYSKPKMFNLANEGNKKAAVIIKLQDSLDLVISSILICSTILNSCTVAVVTRVFTELFGDETLFLASIVTSIFIVLFAEIFPKMLTITNPERSLLSSAYFIKCVYIALKPISNVMGYAAKCLAYLMNFSLRRNANKSENSLEELQGAIALHESLDVEDTKKEKEMMRSVLDLGKVKVGNIMVHRKNVTMFCVDEDRETLVDRIINCSFTRVPLWSGNQDNIVGIIHVEDLLKKIKKNGSTSGINIMDIVRKPWFISENTDLLDQLQAFRQKHEHLSIVNDEYGSFIGIITLEDIIEEIVGNIEDEHDIGPEESIKKQKDGSYVIDGSVNVRDLNKELESKFNEDIAATIAGFVINSIGVIPEVGQSFVLEGYKFDILERQENQVTSLRLTKIIEEQDVEEQ